MTQNDCVLMTTLFMSAALNASLQYFGYTNYQNIERVSNKLKNPNIMLTQLFFDSKLCFYFVI